jgi:hypothetical protein
MTNNLWSGRSWTGRTAAALAAAMSLGLASPSAAQDDVAAAAVGENISFSAGVDFISHFISFGADVWGGGTDAYPFSSDSTIFAHGTIGIQFTEQLSGFFNVWSDINDNTQSAIGGSIQEVDINVGLAYTVEAFTFGINHNNWIYAGDEENAVEFTVAYDDSELWGGDFALNPSFLAHYRYQGQAGQDESTVLQLGVGPTVYTAMEESDYPISIKVPANVGFFTGEYQGGDSGLGYVNVGVVASVPLTFIPVGFGEWSASVSAVLWHTPDDQVPNNPDDTFVVTALSIGASF